jgi:glyoxylase-like metal-dependent hydrolase (beta-lactamase superfamily II)
VVAAGFATHAHHDHVLWHPELGGPPRWASQSVARQAAANRADFIAALGPHLPAAIADLVGKLAMVDGDRLPWDFVDIELITHDAHAPGHTALWLPESRVLVAGDMLSDVELPLLEESSLADYDNGLNALQPYALLAREVVPGHGHPAIGRRAATARWTADRRYLDALIDGSGPADDRISQPGMRKAHRDNASRAQG